MTILWIMVVAVIVLAGAGHLYSRFIARSIGEDPSRPTPALSKPDGRDFVPTPAPIVFAHHFASIAGAGPILGPVLAIAYGWLPALLWVLLGSVFIGAVHDYLATHMATREGGQSIATIARRLLGKDAFIAITIFLIVMLALVCSAFLNASATALTSTLPFERIELAKDQSLFRTVSETVNGLPVKKVVIGGIASMSVIVITIVAPVLGWLYVKKKVSVLLCSMLAIGICTVSIAIGLYYPVHFPSQVGFLGASITGQQIWMFMLSGYVLVAAGVPVWIFLQSRDFINVHILYVGMAVLMVTLIKAAFGGQSLGMPAFNVAEGTEAVGMAIWPGLFIVIACGAVSGFHSLCGGGTTCKQIKAEVDARRIGYGGMLLESFLAVCVICVLLVGASKLNYLTDVHPKMVGIAAKGNPILGFAMAVGNAVKIAWGVPIAIGALAGMILLEGFLVTTLDTAIRLTRYLIEEVWRTLLGKYDVFASPQAADEAEFVTGETPTGTDGIPTSLARAEPTTPADQIVQTRGLFRGLLLVLRQYWVNSGIAVALMLAFALSGGFKLLWGIFATSNQLLAAIVLGIAGIWLMRKGKRSWFALIPAVGMFATTGASLFILFEKYRSADPPKKVLLAADVILALIAAYLLFAGLRQIIRMLRNPKAAVATPEP